jgi:NAD(P)-dependent dehydrogenase (short-subunit alcohol dehydrogenase family)
VSTTSLNGLVALVTGAGGNIGTAICKALTSAGAVVEASDIRGAASNGLLVHDVTSPHSWAAVIDDIAARHGRLDILVNNAGIAPMGLVEDIGLDEWRKCLAINVESALIGMQAALSLLRAAAPRAGGASIVNIASGAANRPTAMSGLYCTSKAALVMISKVAAIEFARGDCGVRVNTVNPGAVASDMIDGILERYTKIAGRPVEDLRKAMESDVPMGRLAKPDDVADGVVFLASSASRYMTGTELHIDGGLTA